MDVIRVRNYNGHRHSHSDEMQTYAMKFAESRGVKLLVYPHEADSSLIELLNSPKTDAVLAPLSDLPYELPSQFAITALLPRLQVRAAIHVTPEVYDIDEDFRIKLGTHVAVEHEIFATQLQRMRPDLKIEVTAQVIQYQAAIFHLSSYNTLHAPSGLRLDCTSAIEPAEMIPMVGAGVLAFVAHRDNTEVRNQLKLLHDTATSQCTNIERGWGRTFAVGDQSVPHAAHVRRLANGNYQGCFGAMKRDMWSHCVINQTTFVGMLETALSQYEQQ